MIVRFVYEPQYASRGWPDDSGVAIVSWYDRALAEPTVGPVFFQNLNLVFAPLIKYQVFPSLFVNVSKFFRPRAFIVATPTVILKNEIRRNKMLRRKPPS